MRYCARPPFALDRIEELPDGRIAYRVKTPRKGKTHRVMTPVEFIARLAAQIPPPRYPTIRYHGVFAPGSKWRKLVVIKAPVQRPKPCAEPTRPESDAKHDAPAATAPATTAHLAPVFESGPTTITVKHWGRLLDGELLATAPRVDWRTLMRRTFGFDALACPMCSKKMRVIAVITDKNVARRILEHLHALPDPQDRALAPARDPTWEQVPLDVGGA